MRQRILLSLAMLVALCAPSDAQTRLVAIVVDFPTSLQTDAQYLQWIRDDVATVDTFTTVENSYGLAPQVTDVVGPFVIDDTGLIGAGAGAALPIAQRAQAAALANGVDLTPYAWQGTLGAVCHCIYLFPDRVGIAGYGNGAGVWIGGAFGRTFPPGFHVLAHEEGHHLFKLTHAHSYGCVDGTPELVCPRGVGAVTADYGDNYDTMGRGLGHFSNAMKAALGWLTLDPLTADGDYLLAPVEAPSGVRGYTFQGGRKGAITYVLEYRQPIGRDSNPNGTDPANVFNGVLVRWLTQNGFSPGGYDTNLLRMNRDNPAFSADFNEAALTVGQTYCDPDARRGFTVLSTSPAGAVFRFSRCR